jgi:hypothetical protein
MGADMYHLHLLRRASTGQTPAQHTHQMYTYTYTYTRTCTGTGTATDTATDTLIHVRSYTWHACHCKVFKVVVVMHVTL